MGFVEEFALCRAENITTCFNWYICFWYYSPGNKEKEEKKGESWGEKEGMRDEGGKKRERVKKASWWEGETEGREPIRGKGIELKHPREGNWLTFISTGNMCCPPSLTSLTLLMLPSVNGKVIGLEVSVL